jgi:hypothetical protein
MRQDFTLEICIHALAQRHILTITQVGIGWEVGVPGGWGTYGVNLGVELARKKALSLRYS